MTLSKSRKAICFILTLLIAAGSILLFGISITKSTVLSQKYMNYVFDKCNVSEQCEKAFKDQISALEFEMSLFLYTASKTLDGIPLCASSTLIWSLNAFSHCSLTLHLSKT